MGLSVVGQWGRMHVVQCQYVSNTQRLADSWTGLMIRGQHLLTIERLIDPWICSMIAFSALIYLIYVEKFACLAESDGSIRSKHITG